MSVFKKQGVYWIDYYVNGRRKRVGPDKWPKQDKMTAWGCLLEDDRDGWQIPWKALYRVEQDFISFPGAIHPNDDKVTT